MIQWIFLPFQCLEWIIRIMFLGVTGTHVGLTVDDYIAAFVGLILAFMLLMIVFYKLCIIMTIFRCCRRLYRYAYSLMYPNGDMPATLSDSQLSIIMGRQMIWEGMHGGDGDGAIRVQEVFLPPIDEDPDDI